MDSVLTWMSENVVLSVGMGAFACGVALFYLVMRRTMKHRDATSDQ